MRICVVIKHLSTINRAAAAKLQDVFSYSAVDKSDLRKEHLSIVMFTTFLHLSIILKVWSVMEFAIHVIDLNSMRTHKKFSRMLVRSRVSFKNTKFL